MNGRIAGMGVAAGLALFLGMLLAGHPVPAYTAFIAAFALFCFTTTL